MNFINILRGKVIGMDKKFEELMQLSKLSALIKREEKKAKCKKTAKVILIILGAILAVVGAGYFLYTKFGKKTDDYDLYDDLDNYYEDDFDNKNILRDINDVCEEDFAE